jgi:putative acetyltransferase
VDLLFTRPRCARRGVASALLHNAEQQLRTAGVDRAISDVSRVARPFFEMMGYTVDREQKVNCRGIELTNFKMSKSLRPVCAG